MSEKKTANTAAKTAVKTEETTIVAPRFDEKGRFLAARAAEFEAEKDPKKVEHVEPARDPKTNRTTQVETDRAAGILSQGEFPGLIEGLRSGVLSLDAGLTALCFKTAATAYTKKCPAVVTAVLGIISATDVLKPFVLSCRRYFEDWGIEFADRPRTEAWSIRNFKEQRALQKRMKGVSPLAYRKDAKAAAERKAEEEERVKHADVSESSIKAVRKIEETANKRVDGLKFAKTAEQIQKQDFYRAEAQFAREAADLMSFIVAKHLPMDAVKAALADLASKLNQNAEGKVA